MDSNQLPTPVKPEIELIFDLASLVGEDSVNYLPKLNPVTGSKEATILLLRVLKWWAWAKSKGRTSFYKFAAPCNNPLCREGDTWLEELGFTRAELEASLRRIATRIVGKVTKESIMERTDTSACVLYFTTAKRVTFYHVNERALFNVFARSYPGKQHQANAENMQQAIAGNQHYLSLHKITILKDHNTESPTAKRGDEKVKNGNSKRKAKPKDERRKHPSVSMVYQVISQQPKKLYWDQIIELGDPEAKGINKLDRTRLVETVQIFVSTGGYEGNLGIWLLDWYVHGVPTHYRNRPVDHPLADKYRRKKSNGVAESSSGESAGGTFLRRAKNE